MVSAIINWLRASSDAVKTSLWLAPGAMFLAGLCLAIWLPRLGHGWSVEGNPLFAWIQGGSGQDAQLLLSTLLTSVITMASMAFSVTVVALSLAASNFGPRLIRVFRANRLNEAVLGTLIMTIVYLLLVLRSVQGSWQATQVPHVAVAVGALLAVLSVLALLAFIQGVATSMTAEEVVRRADDELNLAISELPDLASAVLMPTVAIRPDFEAVATRIPLPKEGYVQSVQFEGILAWAAKRQAVVRLDFKPGDFVVDGDRKVLLYPCPEDVDQVRRQIGQFIVSGQARTPNQDLEFAIRHLVEVAVRALSPGINDPFTALAVIDRLRGGASRLCVKQLPSDVLHDGAGEVRLLRRVTTYAGAIDAAFNQIRQAGSTKPAVLIHLLDAIGSVGSHARTAEQRLVLSRHARLTRSAGLRDIAEPDDRENLERGFEKAMLVLR
ncbi:DUF2254 domain-containing protein [Aquincola tertiaricarbonis]|uniref:DUF2254 domain-containing protein n=1 Tax=Aquincola tertiaricarbonis TaxID=391953 RepID=UPI000614AD31|nr:DUF2254 domain-containing protein [Aquincola tertiaricarbonis]